MRIANQETALIVQIESGDGLENIDAIAAVPGVDVLWIGQYDLTASLGIPGQFEHPRFQAALDRVVAASERHGKAAAMSSDSPDDLRGLGARGFRCLSYGHDVIVYGRALAAGIAEVRGGIAVRR